MYTICQMSNALQRHESVPTIVVGHEFVDEKVEFVCVG